MGRKTNKQKADDLLAKLSKKEIKELFLKYAKQTDYEEVEAKFDIRCPHCDSNLKTKQYKTEAGLTRFKCKECGKKYTIFTGTILQNTPYSWKVWVNVMDEMLRGSSILTIQDRLIKANLVPTIDELTVSAMVNKIRDCFAHMPLPTLTGVIQVDEKHFKESQKGVKNSVDVFDTNTRRQGRKRTEPTLYGTMGPEFSTVCCAVDGSGHAVAKVLTLGKMTLEMFEDELACRPQ